MAAQSNVVHELKELPTLPVVSFIVELHASYAELFCLCILLELVLWIYISLERMFISCSN